MGKGYQFTSEEIAAIEAARKRNRDKRVEARLKALELRACGMSSKEVSKVTGFHPAYITTLVAKYREKGLEYLAGKHNGGNHRNMSYEEEEEILAPYAEKAKAGMIVETSEIKAAYQEKAGHSISSGQIYRVLARHGWRKVMPRSRHPKKASEEVIATSKKLTKKCRNCGKKSTSAGQTVEKCG